MSTTTGKVSQIIGPVIDVEFNTENNELPKIYDSLEIKKADGSDADLKNILGSVALSITPSTEAQVDIIKKLAPGTIPSKDKFGNIILSFYYALIVLMIIFSTLRIIDSKNYN